MPKMYLKIATILLARIPLYLLLALCILISNSSGQGKPDIKVDVELSSKTARGGESLSYNIVVMNIGTALAGDSYLINETETVVRELAASTSKGSCEVTNQGLRPRLQCKFGDLEPEESVQVTVEAKLIDLGEPDDPDGPILLGGGNYTGPINTSGSGEQSGLFINKKNLDKSDSIPESTDLKSLLGEVRAESIFVDSNPADNHVDVEVTLFRSKNRPPKVQITSPNYTAVLTKPLSKAINVPITIKAMDADGFVRKVMISIRYEPVRNYLGDDGKLKLLLGGKIYTREELQQLQIQMFEALKEGTLKEIPGNRNLGTATSTGKDTYQFSIEELGYGENTITACGEDDGGRVGCDRLTIKVKSDSQINIQAPMVQVRPPGATVIIETSSDVGTGIKPKVLLHGLNGEYFDENAPQMTQVARNGNTYTHRLVWKPREEGYYTFRAVLFENGVDTDTQSQKGLLIAEPRVIKILSLADGQECTESQPCNITVSEHDVKGNAVRDKLELFVDGKSFGTINSLECGYCEPRSRALRFPSFGKGRHSLQIVATHELGIELGRSEIYTFTIK